MSYKFQTALFLLLSFLTSCGTITIMEDVIATDQIVPKINNRITLRDIKSDGFLLDYKKDYFGKDDSSYKCIKPLKQEFYNLTLDINGNIKTSILNNNISYSGYNFFNGKPYQLTKGLGSVVLNLNFFDLNLHSTNSINTSFLLGMPLDYFILEKNKIIFKKENEYYLYGTIGNKKYEKIYAAYIKDEKLVNLSYSETIYRTNEIYNATLTPKGELFFITSIDEEFGFSDQRWLTKYDPFNKSLTFNVKMDERVGNNPMLYKNGDLIIFPDLLIETYSKIPVLSVNVNNFKISNKTISILDQEKILDLKIWDIYGNHFLGYVNKLNESIIYKLGDDLAIKNAFKVGNFDYTFLNYAENSVNAFEFSSPKETGELVKSKIRIHSGYGIYRDKILFEGIGFRTLCSSYQ